MPKAARVLEREDRRLDRAIRAALVVAAFAPFVGTLLYGFVYDDSVILLHNPVIVGWQSLLEVWKHPYWATGGPAAGGLYRPVEMFFFAIIWNGLHRFPIAFHLFAIALHATATLLLAAVLRRAFGRWPAAAAALWFAVQPVHVEAVANVSNVSEVMVAIWALLLALLLLPARTSGVTSTEPPGWPRAIGAALVYAIALFTKESAAVAPALALVLAIGWRTEGAPPIGEMVGHARAWMKLIILWGIALIAVVLVRRVVTGAVVGHGSLAVPGLAELNGMQRVVAMLSTGGHVARLLLWPTMQSPDYGPSELAGGIDRLLAAIATGLTITLLLIWAGRRAFRAHAADARPLVAVLWTLIAYFPASNLIGATGPILAERTLYVASVGIAMLVAWVIERVARRAAQWGRVHWASRSSVLRRAPILAIVAAMVVVCGRAYVQTKNYARTWRSDHTVFERIVTADSLNYRGYQLLALEAQAHGHVLESDSMYRRAYTLRSFDPLLLVNYGEYLLERGQPQHAMAVGQRILRDSAMRVDDRAVTLWLNATGRLWGPDSVLIRAQHLNAQAPTARAALFIGIAYDAKGDSAAAQVAYRLGLKRAPHDSTLAAHVATTVPVGSLDRVVQTSPDVGARDR